VCVCVCVCVCVWWAGPWGAGFSEEKSGHMLIHTQQGFKLAGVGDVHPRVKFVVGNEHCTFQHTESVLSVVAKAC
jgi:hypothetical protein